GARTRRYDAALFCCDAKLAAPRISRIGENVVVAWRRPELYQRPSGFIRTRQRRAWICSPSAEHARRRRKSECSRRARPADYSHELVPGLLPKRSTCAALTAVGSRRRHQFYDARKRIGIRWLYLTALSHGNGASL